MPPGLDPIPIQALDPEQFKEFGALQTKSLQSVVRQLVPSMNTSPDDHVALYFGDKAECRKVCLAFWTDHYIVGAPTYIGSPAAQQGSTATDWDPFLAFILKRLGSFEGKKACTHKVIAHGRIMHTLRQLP